jgi:hypothetical protein
MTAGQLHSFSAENFSTLTGAEAVSGCLFYPAYAQVLRVIGHSSPGGNTWEMHTGNAPRLLCRGTKALSGEVGGSFYEES